MSNFFWNNYSGEEPTNYNDGSDNMGNAGYSIGIYHVISNISIYFKAFITQYNETFDSDWAAETVYGRADPIYTFKSTTRNISLGFKLPAASISEGYENLAKVQQLAQFLYPAYEDVSNANTIAQSPLVRLKMMNFLQAAPFVQSSNSSAAKLLSDYAANQNATAGVLGLIKNLTINHNLADDAGTLELKPGGPAGATVLPKVIELNLTFSPIHESPLGWTQTIYDSQGQVYTGDVTAENQSQFYYAVEFASKSYPYGASLAGTTTLTQVDAGGEDQAGEDQQTAGVLNALNQDGTSASGPTP